MLKLLVAIIMSLFFINDSFAHFQENDEESLTEREKMIIQIKRVHKAFVLLPEGTTRYFQKKNGKEKVLKPLTEFKVDKKYCLHGSDNWDEHCQDAALKYAFGENWREFKKAIVTLLDDIKNERDLNMDLFADEYYFEVSEEAERTDDLIYEDEYDNSCITDIRYKPTYGWSREDHISRFKSIISYYVKNGGIKYEDFIVKGHSMRIFRESMIINILFDTTWRNEKDDNAKPQPIPKIYSLYRGYKR